MSEFEVPTPWKEHLPEGRAFTLDYEELTPLQFFERRAKSDPNVNMLILPKGASLTFGQVWDMVMTLAGHLQKLGIEKGDRVALMLNNVPHYVIAHYAILAVGGTVVQVSPLYTEHELKHIITDSGAKALFTLTMFQEKANNVMDSSDLEFVIYCQIKDYLKGIIKFLGKILKGKASPIFDPKDETYDAPMIRRDNVYWFQDLLVPGPKYTPVEVDFENDVAVFQYTGGTTGFPKGAMLTHKNISVNAQQARAMIYMVPDKTGAVMAVLPLFHIFGLTVCMNLSIQLGVPQILSIARPPDFSDILSWIEKYKISFFPGIPRIFIELNKHPKTPKTDFSSLIAAISGGDSLPLVVAQEWKKNTDSDLVEGYGLSETSPLTNVNPIGFTPREGSIGLPAPNTLVKIVDVQDYNKTLEIGEIGEVCVKGPQVFKGYWQMKEETENVLKSDGWFRTGDIGKMDEDGYAYIVDRKKDMIIVSGYNVYPREVEEVLFKHPKIQEAAVAGIKDEKRGEIVGAWVVLKEGQTATKEEIIDFTKEYLAPFKVPKEITFRDELPTTIIGKVMRRKLNEE